MHQQPFCYEVPKCGTHRLRWHKRGTENLFLVTVRLLHHPGLLHLKQPHPGCCCWEIPHSIFFRCFLVHVLIKASLSLGKQASTLHLSPNSLTARTRKHGIPLKELFWGSIKRGIEDQQPHIYRVKQEDYKFKYNLGSKQANKETAPQTKSRKKQNKTKIRREE